MDKTKPKFFIYFAAISINLICFATGTAYSWTSPLLPKFESDDPNINPIGRPLTTTESGLLVSIINSGQLLGPFVSGFLTGKLGKKSTLLISGLPLFIGHVMCSFATSIEVFLTARVLMGVSSGSVWSLIPGYLSEISEPANRGMLNSLMLAISCFGSLFGYLTGPFVSIKWFSIINLIPVAAFLVLVFVFVPNSPYDLVMRRDLAGASKSLVKLRQTTDVEKELVEIERTISSNAKSHATLKDIFVNKGSSTALLICGGLMAFNSFSGMLVVLGYTQTILDLAGGIIPSAYSAILVGTVSVVATLLNSQLIDRLGRRPIIIVSCIFACLGHAGLSIFFHLQSRGYAMPDFQWVPILSLVMLTFFYNFGLGSLPWVVLGELFASNIKAVASAFCTSINYVLGFTITFCYPFVVAYIGIANTFLIFATMMMGCAVFCVVKLPETKGKRFEEIFELLNEKS